MSRRIRIDFRKWPDTRHWQLDMQFLGEDEHGMWVWRGVGWRAQRGHEAPVTARYPAVKVLTPGEWWTAMWVDERPTAVYVDIVTPGTWDGNRITMIDLDLDVVRRGLGPVEVHDEDEFAENRVELGYPGDVAARAEETTMEIVEALEAGREPFGGTAARWLDRARRLAATEGAPRGDRSFRD